MPVHNRILSPVVGQPQNQIGPTSLMPDGLISVGAVVRVEVHLPPPLADLLTKQGLPVPSPQVGIALIDTGATMTCVHEPLLQALGLKPSGIVDSLTANGPVRQNTYAARLILPGESITMDIPMIPGVNLAGQMVPLIPPEPLVALLGRNFLAGMMLVWNGPLGIWTLSF